MRLDNEMKGSYRSFETSRGRVRGDQTRARTIAGT